MYLLGCKDRWDKEFAETPKERRKVKRIRTTNITPYLKDYTFFALSPLYVYAGVSYSMPDQFEIEAGPQDRILVDYQRDVIGGVGKWGRYIEGISTTVWEDFCHYLGTVMFYAEHKGLVWFIRHQEINLEDTSNKAIIDPSRLPVRLHVFMPDGNKGRMFAKAGAPATLKWLDAHPKVVEATKIVMSKKGRIDHGH